MARIPSPSIKLVKRIALGAGALALVVAIFVLSLLADSTRRMNASLDRLQGQLGDLNEAVDSLEAARLTDIRLPVSPLLVNFELDLPGRGEVFPAMGTGNVPEYWPVAVLRITNTANRPVAQVISAEIPGWSRRTEKTLLIGPGEMKRLDIDPELLSIAYRNDEIHPATLEIRAAGLDGSVIYAESRPVLVHGGSEIYWGKQFANAQIAARWVTPHDRDVLELISKARKHITRGRMAGYSGSSGGPEQVARHVRDQARAVFRALQESGITYVSSKFVMGEYVDQAQRVRLPRETLHLASANCMDVSVVFASAMENLGMQPLLIIVPGHAFTGVRLARDSEQVLYLDLTVLPKGSFESAIARAESWMKRTPRERVLVVDVAAARALGIYPLGSDLAVSMP